MAPATGPSRSQRVIRNAVHAFSRARDPRTRGGVAARISEPSREAATPRGGPPWPAASPLWAARRRRGMPCAALLPDNMYANKRRMCVCVLAQVGQACLRSQRQVPATVHALRGAFRAHTAPAGLTLSSNRIKRKKKHNKQQQQHLLLA